MQGTCERCGALVLMVRVPGWVDPAELDPEPHEAGWFIVASGHTAEAVPLEDVARLMGEGVPMRPLHHEVCAKAWRAEQEVKVKRKRVRTAHGWRTR